MINQRAFVQDSTVCSSVRVPKVAQCWTDVLCLQQFCMSDAELRGRRGYHDITDDSSLRPQGSGDASLTDDDDDDLGLTGCDEMRKVGQSHKTLPVSHSVSDIVLFDCLSLGNADKKYSLAMYC